MTLSVAETASQRIHYDNIMSDIMSVVAPGEELRRIAHSLLNLRTEGRLRTSSLGTAFAWYETEEGWHYWNFINDAIERNRRLPYEQEYTLEEVQADSAAETVSGRR